MRFWYFDIGVLWKFALNIFCFVYSWNQIRTTISNKERSYSPCSIYFTKITSTHMPIRHWMSNQSSISEKISIFLLLLNFYLPTYFGSRSSHSADLHSTVWIYLVIQPKLHYANHIHTVIIVICIVLFWKKFWSHSPRYERTPCIFWKMKI